MDLLGDDRFNLRTLEKINILLGKNGCGKSYILRQVDEALHRPGRANIGKVRYVTPERGGILQYEPGTDQAIAQNPEWMPDQRRKNRHEGFRQQSTALFRQLEFSVLLKIEQAEGQPNRGNFEGTVQKLNTLLERVHIRRDRNRAFRVFNRQTNAEANPESLSSGECELIALGIEFLAFADECEAGKDNILLVDEPDVHLHPDLQDRLAGFVVDALADKPVTLILATHSTSLLAGFARRASVNVCFMRRGEKNLTFRPVSDLDKAILPVFGAHPLSNVFNKSPVLLMEGEDDERLWQQVQRSSNGRVRIQPCVVGSIDRLAEFETEVNRIVEAVYDEAQAYSLRDRDTYPEAIDDVGRVMRMRLSCRAAENLMLTDEALTTAGTNWGEIQDRVRQWVEANQNHQYHADVKAFVDAGFDRKGHDLKSIRNILVGMMSNKPWEVLVGQSIAALTNGNGQALPGSLGDYLGEKVCTHLLKLNELANVNAAAQAAAS